MASLASSSWTFSRATFVSAPNNICAEVCFEDFPKIVLRVFLHYWKTIGWEKDEALSSSLCSNSCVYLVTFSSMTLESWVPPFWLPNQPMCLWGGMQHTGLLTATLICCCSGITEYNKNPKCSSFGFLCSASKQKLQSGNLKMGVRIPGPIHSFYICTHSAITL